MSELEFEKDTGEVNINATALSVELDGITQMMTLAQKRGIL